jgi:hypothetical protein
VIYAVDFDGTLCENKYPEIGHPNKELIDFLKIEKRYGAEIILWTMREGETLERAVAWCKEQGLEFDTVNDNLPRLKKAFKNNPRKVYADRYIDDHNWMAQAIETYQRIEKFLREYIRFPPDDPVTIGDLKTSCRMLMYGNVFTPEELRQEAVRKAQVVIPADWVIIPE